MTQNKNIVLLAGEPSGDAIAAKIIPHLGDFQLSGTGGNKMISQGFTSIFDISEISVMGFFEVIKHLGNILKRINETVRHIQEISPRIIVTFDSPGFAKAVVKKLRKRGYSGEIIHIVAPTVWAYKPKRAKIFAKYFDAICCFLPFEPEYFEKYGLKSHFVGNVAIEDELLELRNNIAKSAVKSGDLINIAITLGSRQMEVGRHLPVISKVMKNLHEKYKNAHFTLPTLPNLQPRIEEYLKLHSEDCNFSIDSSSDAINNAIYSCNVAIAKSGTNTTQFLVNSKPIVVYYKVHPLSYLMIKVMMTTKFVNLVNIIAKKMIIPELIQGRANPENITREISKIIDNLASSSYQIQPYLLEMLPNSTEKPSKIIADIIIKQAS